MTKPLNRKHASGSIRSLLAAGLVALSMAPGALAVTRTGRDSVWSQPDPDSFDVPYNAGDPAVFDGAGPSTVHIAAGGVTPSIITIKRGTYTFMIGGDHVLGNAPITCDEGRSVTYFNTAGREVTLSNNFVQPNGGNILNFAGADFRLTGTVSGGGNGGPNISPAPGINVTLEHGVSGTASEAFSIAPAAAGGTVRINGASTAYLASANADVTIQIGADDALGGAAAVGTGLADVGGATKLEAVGGTRTLSNNFNNRGMSVLGSYDLTLNGYFEGNESRFNLTKMGPATLTLGADNTASNWAHTIRIREGVVRLGHVNARGASGVQFSGGVLELGAGDFTLPTSNAPQSSASVGWVTDGAYGGSGGFSAYGANRSVNLGGAGAPVAWGAGGFVPAGQALVFGSTQSDARLDFQNPINLGGAVRTIRVDDNPDSTADRAVLSGVLAGTVGNGLTKTGAGLLLLNATNTYSGVTTVTAGSLGGTGRLAGSVVFEAAAAGHAELGASAATSKRLTVGGSLTLNDNTLLVQGPSVLETGEVYVVMAVTGTISGSFYPTPSWVGPVPEHGTNFTVVTDAGAKEVRLQYAPGGQNVVQVTFDAQGGTTPSPASKSVTYLSPYGALATTTRTGYTFAGWWTDASGGTEVTSATIVATAVPHTLYARWTVLTYPVTYAPNGATSGTVPASQTKTYGIVLTLAANTGNLARTDYTYAGWNTAANGGGTNYAAGGSYAADAAVTLYAKWTLNADRVRGATNTWDGSTDMTWSQPDSTSWSGAIYSNGNETVFGGLGLGTVTIAAGGVIPGSIAIKQNGYTFAVGEDNALGTANPLQRGLITSDYAKSSSYSNTTGHDVLLGNDFSQPNGGNVLNFVGGDFRLTGTVQGGANFGPKLTPAAGTTLTLDHGVSGSGDFSITSDATGATIRILGASSARLSAIQSRGVRIEIGADNALGPAGAEASISVSPPTFVAYGGPRSIASGIYSRGFAVTGEHDLTISGPIRNAEGYYVDKSGPAALVLAAANPDWGNVVRIREGTVRLSHTNALGTSAVHFSGGVLELAAGDFSRSLSSTPGAGSGRVGWVADGASGAGGGFSAYGTNRHVNIGGLATQLTWGVNGFVAAGQPLVFGSRSANAPIEFLNPINLGGSGLQGMLPPVQAFVFGAKSAGATLEYPPPGPRGGTVRTIRVDDNPASAADVAVLSGVLSGASDMGLDKTGNGTLFLSATNRYTGDTTVSAGSIGGSGRLAGSLFFGTNTSFVVDVGIANGPLVVAGFADLGNAATLTMRGVPPASVRYPVLQALAGFMGTGRFAHVNLPPGWVVDYSASGEIAIKPDSE